MSSLINYTIPQRNFELIRDRIAMILFVELDNQYRRYNPDAHVDGVYTERKRPIDQNELAFINVSVVAGNFDNKSTGRKDGTYQFSVDIFTRVPSDIGADGDSASQKLMQRVAGICDYILEDPQYKTLSFTPGFIANFLVSNLQIRAQDNEDANNIAMGRLTITLRCSENNALIAGTTLLNSTTTFNLEYTTRGYQYVTT